MSSMGPAKPRGCIGTRCTPLATSLSLNMNARARQTGDWHDPGAHSWFSASLLRLGDSIEKADL